MAQWLKNPPTNAGDEGDGSSIPGLGRSPGEGNGNLYFCLENLMDRGAWWTTVHMVAKRGHDQAQGIHVTQSQGWHPVTFAVIYQKRDPFYTQGDSMNMRKWGSWEILYNLSAASRMGTRRLLYLMTPCVLGRKEKGDVTSDFLFHIVHQNCDACVHVLSRFSCVRLCDPMDRSPPGSLAHGILQAKMLQWVAMLSPPGDLSDPGIEPVSPALQANSLSLGHWGKHDAHPGQLKGRPGTLSHVQLLYFL